MYVIRPVKDDDLDALIALAAAGGAGLTTLPKSRGVLSERIETSLASFAKPVEKPGEEYYLFVLEETETGDVVGTSGIFARVGFNVLAATMASLSACDTMTARQRNTAIGAGVGGVAGAAIGGNALSTLGGAAVGGIIGNQVGK